MNYSFDQYEHISKMDAAADVEGIRYHARFGLWELYVNGLIHYYRTEAQAKSVLLRYLRMLE